MFSLLRAEAPSVERVSRSLAQTHAVYQTGYSVSFFRGFSPKHHEYGHRAAVGVAIAIRGHR